MAQIYYPGSIHDTKAGKVQVIERVPSTKKVRIKFMDTGSEKVVYRETIRRGNLKDNHLPSVVGVGFLGTGEYSHKEHSKLYDCWASMLKRCYASDNYNVTYKDCSVVEDWFNFQTFADWATHNGFEKNMQLDKDIKIKGNKVYGPDTCMFVTAADNTAEKNARYVDEVSHEYALIVVNTGEVIEGKNKNEFIRTNGLNSNFFSMLERGKYQQSHGYCLPAAYFALAGEAYGKG